MRFLKNCFTVIFAGMLLAACSSKPATSYTIEGEITGLDDGTEMELVPGATHKNEKPIATAVVKDGKFTFTGSTDEPRMFYIGVKDAYMRMKLMVENANIKLTANAETVEQNGSLYYKFSNVKVEGCASHDLYKQKIAPRTTLDSLYQVFQEENKELISMIGAARLNNDKQLMDSLKNTDALKKISQEENQFFVTVETEMKKIVMDNKDSWWGPLLMLDLMSYFTPEQKNWYEAFSEEAKESYYGKIVKEELFPEGFVGKSTPAFVLENADKTETSLSEVTKGKKYYLIDFWASWCAPCRKEIPNLKKLYAAYSNKGFEIVSISIDKKEADWKKALEEEQLAWPNFLDTKGASDAFRVKAIPAMFLVNEQGVVIEENIRGEALEKKLAELFK